MAFARASPMPGSVASSFSEAELMSMSSAFFVSFCARCWPASGALSTANAASASEANAAATRASSFFIVVVLLLRKPSRLGVAAQPPRERDQRGHIALLGALAPILELVHEL